MHNVDGRMPSPHTFGLMHYDAQMNQEIHTQPKPMTCHLSTVSAKQQTNHPTDTNTTLDAPSMYYRKTYKMDKNQENGKTEQGLASTWDHHHNMPPQWH